MNERMDGWMDGWMSDVYFVDYTSDILIELEILVNINLYTCILIHEALLYFYH